jgi:hypothetical protein
MAKPRNPKGKKKEITPAGDFESTEDRTPKKKGEESVEDQEKKKLRLKILKKLMKDFPPWTDLGAEDPEYIKAIQDKYQSLLASLRPPPAPPAQWKQDLAKIPKSDLAPTTAVKGVQGTTIEPRSRWAGGRKVGGPFGAASGPNPPVRSGDIDIDPQPTGAAPVEPDPIPAGLDVPAGKTPAQFAGTTKQIATKQSPGLTPQQGGPTIDTRVGDAPDDVPTGIEIDPNNPEWKALSPEVQGEIIRRIRMSILKARGAASGFTGGGKGGKRKIWGTDMSGPGIDPDEKDPEKQPKEPITGRMAPAPAGERQLIQNDLDRIKHFIENWGDYAIDKFSSVGSRSKKRVTDPEDVVVKRWDPEQGKEVEFTYKGSGGGITRTGGEMARSKQRALNLIDALPRLSGTKMQQAHNIIYDFIRVALKGARAKLRRDAYDHLVDKGLIDAQRGRGVKFDPRTGELSYLANRDAVERSKEFNDELAAISKKLDADATTDLANNRLLAKITGGMKKMTGRSGGADPEYLSFDKPTFDPATGIGGAAPEKTRAAGVFSGENPPLQDPDPVDPVAIDPDTGEEIVGKQSGEPLGQVRRDPGVARTMGQRSHTMAPASKMSPEMTGGPAIRVWNDPLQKKGGEVEDRWMVTVNGVQIGKYYKKQSEAWDAAIEASKNFPQATKRSNKEPKPKPARSVHARDPRVAITDPWLRAQVAPATRDQGGGVPTPQPEEPRSPGGYILRKKKPVKDWFDRYSQQVLESVNGDGSPNWWDDL